MKIIIGISGSSGSLYAQDLIQKLSSKPAIQLALVMSDNAKKNWEIEIGNTSYEQYKEITYSKRDFMAPFASGSAQWDAMVVCPCSAGFMGRVASGVSDDLMTRTADVMLKERKKLILVLRETPLHLIHIENMRKITLAGGILCPAIPSFYSQPKTIQEVIATVTNRVIDLLGVSHDSYRWGS
ncbi:MAG: UbiX family flavin prenyltransferase [Saprospiraceae bacterium]|nr:UbiX family flavin prenyltransferase [Saprospiraceae bacterium]